MAAGLGGLAEDLYRRFSNEWNALHDRKDTSRYKPYFLGRTFTSRTATSRTIRNLLADQDAVSEARQPETLICDVSTASGGTPSTSTNGRRCSTRS